MQGPAVKPQYGCSANTVVGNRRKSATTAGMIMVEKAVIIVISYSFIWIVSIVRATTRW
jgi:hypothetical protein